MSTAHTPTLRHALTNIRHCIDGSQPIDTIGATMAIDAVLGKFGSPLIELAEEDRKTNKLESDNAALVAALERTLAQLDSLANCTVETQTGLIDPRKSPAYAESRAALAAAKE